MLTPPAHRRLAAGFTLIEVLVTLVVLMFGLLGTAGLLVRGQRATYEAYQRQQALAIATEIAERMRANSASAAAYAAAAPVATPLGAGIRFNNIGSSIPNCGPGTTCTAAQLADYDTAMWDGLLAGVTEVEVATGFNVGGLANARGCIAGTGAAAIAGVGLTGTVWRVQVAWQGRDATTAPPAGLACGTGQYGAENLRRVVSVDVIGVQ
jgi:type IV pilus assembly protein PilV